MTSVPRSKGEGEWPRKEFIYWTDDGSVAALRYGNWKITFLEQKARRPARVAGALHRAARAACSPTCAWTPSSGPRRRTPWAYQRWYMERMFLIAPAGAYVGQWLQSFKEFPPRQKPGSFNLERVMEAVIAAREELTTRTAGTGVA